MKKGRRMEDREGWRRRRKKGRKGEKGRGEERGRKEVGQRNKGRKREKGRGRNVTDLLVVFITSVHGSNVTKKVDHLCLS